MHLPIYLLVDFQYFKIRKPTILCNSPNLVSEPLACLKFSDLCPDLYHSFSVPSVCRVDPKISVYCLSVIFPSPFSTLRSLVWQVVFVREESVVYREEHSQDYLMMLHVGYRDSTADHDTQTYCLGPMLNCFDWSFFMGRPRGYLFSYQNLWLFIICVPDMDVTENNYGKCTADQNLALT